MEVDLNVLITTFGVVISLGILTITYYRWVHLRRSERKRRERIEEKRKLERKRDTFSQCELYIKQNSERVEQNDFSTSDVGTWNLPQQFVSKVEKYIEDFHLCSDLLVACQNAIRLDLREIAKKELATTLKEYNLDEALQAEDLVIRYIRGEEVTKRWIEKTYPSLFSDIMKHLKEQEKTLDMFFIKVNKAFIKNRILTRFRKERGNLIELGHQIMKSLQHEVELLNKELSKYSDIQEEEVKSEM